MGVRRKFYNSNDRPGLRGKPDAAGAKYVGGSACIVVGLGIAWWNNINKT